MRVEEAGAKVPLPEVCLLPVRADRPGFQHKELGGI